MGIEWIRRANARFVGRTEFRQVVMEIGAGAGVRVLHIRTLRENNGDIARTLCCVTEPLPFRNVNYVAVERRGDSLLEVRLYLPFAGGSMHEVPASRYDEGLVGSDFTYHDFRVWLDEEGCLYSPPERLGDTVRIRGSSATRNGGAPFDVWLDSDTGFVNRIQYLAPHGSAVVREYRAEDPTTIDGVLIPRRMMVRDVRSNHATTLRLERAWYDRPLEPRIFEPASRRDTYQMLADL